MRLRQKLQSFLFQAVYRSGLLCLVSNICSRLKRGRILIFTFHRIGPVKNNQAYLVYPFPPERFSEQINYLSRHLRVISLTEAVDRINSGNIDNNYVVITFDDGFADFYDYAYPILKKHDLPATIFLTTGLIDRTCRMWTEKLEYAVNNSKVDTFTLNTEKDPVRLPLNNLKDKYFTLFEIYKVLIKLDHREKEKILEKICDQLGARDFNDMPDNILTWDQIRQMAENKISFGAHTVNHPVLSRISIEEAEKELLESKARIEKELGKKTDLFAFPNGKRNDYTDDNIEKIKRIGFKTACTTEWGLNSVSSDTFQLRRIHGMNEDLWTFAAKTQWYLACGK